MVIYSNTIDKTIEEEIKNKIEVIPQIKEMKITMSGSYITINGYYEPYTKYIFKLNKDIKDIYGNLLGEQKVTFKGDN